MTRVNHTIDDRSPLIQYGPPGFWRLGTSSDPLSSRYSNNGTFMVTSNSGASATFTFNGTAVWIFGAKRGNHGPYEVNLDNAIQTFDGFFNDPGQFQIPLFAADGLVNGLHTVTLTNRFKSANQPYLDVDFVTWTSEVEDVSLPQRILPHTDSSFQYDPPAAWDTPVSSGFNSSTSRSTSTSNASAKLNFTGTSVSIFGAVSGTTGPYSVQLDNRPPKTFNASVGDYTPQTLLYYADNLGPGVHVVQLTNLPDQPGQGIQLDYALVTVGRSDGSSGSKSSSLSSGAIAGIAVGAVALLAAIALLAFFWWTTRRRGGTGVNQLPSPMMVTPFTGVNSAILPHQRGYSASEQTSVYPAPDMASMSAASGSRILASNRTRSDSDSPTEIAQNVSTPSSYPQRKTRPATPTRTHQPSSSQATSARITLEGEMDAPPSYSHAARYP